MKWGTGGINIDECRIPAENNDRKDYGRDKDISYMPESNSLGKFNKNTAYKRPEEGRFPSNIILDEEAGKMLDEQSGETISKWGTTKNRINKQEGFLGGLANEKESFNSINKYIGDKGGASRFFYCAKASKSERNFGCEDLEPKQRDEGRKEGNPGGENPRNRVVQLRTNNHPTVKPIKLMEYLIKLVSREGATVLDPFGGSGTTAIACIKLGRIPILIEKEEEYVKIANARIKPYLEQTKL